MARDLNTLLRVSTIIGSADSVDALQRQLSDLILEVVPAARCTILATGDEGADPSVVAWSVHHAAETAPPRVSRTLVRKVLDEGTAMLCKDVAKGLDADAKTLMCVPLTNLDRGVGVIYLESLEASVPFEEGHLQLVTAIARIGALALGNTRRLDRLRTETDTLIASDLFGHERGAFTGAIAQKKGKIELADGGTLFLDERVTGIAPAARACLRGYGWPGNVRELQNAIERAVVIGVSDELRLEDLPEAIADAAVPETTAVIRFQDGVREAKRRLVNNAVRETGGVYTEAAKLLGLHPNYLHGLIRNLNLKDELTRLKAELG